LESTRAPIAGPMPRAQRACTVRVAAKVQELATERTERVMTALKIEGRALIPASWKDKTKGEYLVLPRRLGRGYRCRRDDEAEEEERDHVEEGDAPEHLLGGLGDRLSWVGGFCCGKTHQLSSTEGKGGSDEHGAETLETVAERTWLVPVVGANVASVVGGKLHRSR